MKPFFQTNTKEILSLLLIISVTLFVYYPVRYFDFVFIDDQLYICNNHHIHNGLTWDGFIWAFFSTRSGSWHPLTWISHMIDISWYHLDAGGHHWTNVQIHLISTIFLFIFFRMTTHQVWVSSAIAACFALHPLHVESVAWISERKDVLSVCLAHLTLLSYLWYTKCETVFRRTIVLLCFCLSLMSKPMMITLPFLLCILDYWPFKRWQKNKTWALMKEKMPLFILALTFAGFTFFSQKYEHAVNSDLALQYRLLNAGIVYVQYLYKMFVPLKLSFFYPHPKESISVIWGVCCLGLTAGLFMIAIYNRARRPYVFTGIVWYLFTLVPVIGIVQIGAQQMADRYTYFPMTGMAIVVFLGLGHSKIRPLIPIALLVLMIGCAIVTRQQVSVWQNSSTLAKQALENTSDKNYIAHYGLAEYDKNNNNFSKAITHYKKTLQIAPGYDRAMFQLAFALEKNNNHDAAIKQYQKILKHDPFNVNAHINIGNIYVNHIHQMKQAMKHYRVALNISPNSPLVLTNFANMMILKKNPKAALYYYSQAIDADPLYLKAYVNLSQLIVTEQAKSKDFLRLCVNQIRGRKSSTVCFLRLSQTFIARKEYQLATFFKEKAHESK